MTGGYQLVSCGGNGGRDDLLAAARMDTGFGNAFQRYLNYGRPARILRPDRACLGERIIYNVPS